MNGSVAEVLFKHANVCNAACKCLAIIVLNQLIFTRHNMVTEITIYSILLNKLE